MEIANKFGNDKQNPDMPSDTLHSPSVTRWLNNDLKTEQTLLNIVFHITPKEMKPNTSGVLEVTSEDMIAVCLINLEPVWITQDLGTVCPSSLEVPVRTVMIYFNVSRQLFSCRCFFSYVTHLTAGVLSSSQSAGKWWHQNTSLWIKSIKVHIMSIWVRGLDSRMGS